MDYFGYKELIDKFNKIRRTWETTSHTANSRYNHEFARELIILTNKIMDLSKQATEVAEQKTLEESRRHTLAFGDK